MKDLKIDFQIILIFLKSELQPISTQILLLHPSFTCNILEEKKELCYGKLCVFGTMYGKCINRKLCYWFTNLHVLVPFFSPFFGVAWESGKSVIILLLRHLKHLLLASHVSAMLIILLENWNNFQRGTCCFRSFMYVSARGTENVILCFVTTQIKLRLMYMLFYIFFHFYVGCCLFSV